MPFPGASPIGSPSGDPLGQPPPSPTGMDPAGGGDTPFSARGLAGGPANAIPANMLPPEVITGLTAAFQQVTAVLDSAAQVTPDKGAQLSLIKDLIQQYLADLMSAGAGAMSPTASGAAFPGGGMAKGISGAGAF